MLSYTVGMNPRLIVIAAATLAALVLAWQMLRIPGLEQANGALEPPPAVDGGKMIAADLRRLGAPAAEQTARPANPAPGLTLSPDVPLLDQLEALEQAAKAGDADAAAALAEGWNACRSSFAMFGQDRQNQVAGRLDLEYQIAEGLLASLDDEQARAAGIQALAELDPAELALELEQDLRQRERFCEGIEATSDWPQRVRQARHWQQRAAELGHTLHRRALVTSAFRDHAWREADIAALEHVRMKPVVLGMLAQGLAQGDPYMLGEMAVFTGEGYFAPPDPLQGYAYSRAYLSLVDAARAEHWHGAVHGLRGYGQVVALDARLAGQLDAANRRRAEAMAGQLADCCRDWMGP